MAKMLSLDDLDAVAAADEAHEFEFTLPDGEGSGLFLQVVGANSPRVKAVEFEIGNAYRKKEAMKAAQRTGSKEISRIEDDVATVHKLAAARIVGWRGLKEEFTPEIALRLVSINPEVANQVTEVSNNLALFTKASPKV